MDLPLLENSIEQFNSIMNELLIRNPLDFQEIKRLSEDIKQLCSLTTDTEWNEYYQSYSKLILNYLALLTKVICSGAHSITHMVSQLIKIMKIISSRPVVSLMVESMSCPVLEWVLRVDIPILIRREVLRVWNECLNNAKREVKRKVSKTLDNFILRLMQLLINCGDYNFQSSILETFFHYVGIKADRTKYAVYFKQFPRVHRAFTSSLFNNFYQDCRTFVNLVNLSLGKGRSVLSLPCEIAYIKDSSGTVQAVMNFWSDFNLGTKIVTLDRDITPGTSFLEDEILANIKINRHTLSKVLLYETKTENGWKATMFLKKLSAREVTLVYDDSVSPSDIQSFLHRMFPNTLEVQMMDCGHADTAPVPSFEARESHIHSLNSTEDSQLMSLSQDIINSSFCRRNKTSFTNISSSLICNKEIEKNDAHQSNGVSQDLSNPADCCENKILKQSSAMDSVIAPARNDSKHCAKVHKFVNSEDERINESPVNKGNFSKCKSSECTVGKNKKSISQPLSHMSVTENKEKFSIMKNNISNQSMGLDRKELKKQIKDPRNFRKASVPASFYNPYVNNPPSTFEEKSLTREECTDAVSPLDLLSVEKNNESVEKQSQLHDSTIKESISRNREEIVSSTTDFEKKLHACSKKTVTLQEICQKDAAENNKSESESTDKNNTFGQILQHEKKTLSTDTMEVEGDNSECSVDNAAQNEASRKKLKYEKNSALKDNDREIGEESGKRNSSSTSVADDCEIVSVSTNKSDCSRVTTTDNKNNNIPIVRMSCHKLYEMLKQFKEKTSQKPTADEEICHTEQLNTRESEHTPEKMASDIIREDDNCYSYPDSDESIISRSQVSKVRKKRKLFSVSRNSDCDLTVESCCSRKRHSINSSCDLVQDVPLRRQNSEAKNVSQVKTLQRNETYKNISHIMNEEGELDDIPLLQRLQMENIRDKKIMDGTENISSCEEKEKNINFLKFNIRNRNPDRWRAKYEENEKIRKLKNKNKRRKRKTDNTETSQNKSVFSDIQSDNETSWNEFSFLQIAQSTPKYSVCKPAGEDKRHPIPKSSSSNKSMLAVSKKTVTVSKKNKSTSKNKRRRRQKEDSSYYSEELPSLIIEVESHKCQFPTSDYSDIPSISDSILLGADSGSSHQENIKSSKYLPETDVHSPEETKLHSKDTKSKEGKHKVNLTESTVRNEAENEQSHIKNSPDDTVPNTMYCKKWFKKLSNIHINTKLENQLLNNESHCREKSPSFKRIGDCCMNESSSVNNNKETDIKSGSFFQKRMKRDCTDSENKDERETHLKDDVCVGKHDKCCSNTACASLDNRRGDTGSDDRVRKASDTKTCRVSSEMGCEQDIAHRLGDTYSNKSAVHVKPDQNITSESAIRNFKRSQDNTTRVNVSFTELVDSDTEIVPSSQRESQLDKCMKYVPLKKIKRANESTSSEKRCETMNKEVCDKEEKRGRNASVSINNNVENDSSTRTMNTDKMILGDKVKRHTTDCESETSSKTKNYMYVTENNELNENTLDVRKSRLRVVKRRHLPIDNSSDDSSDSDDSSKRRILKHRNINSLVNVDRNLVVPHTHAVTDCLHQSRGNSSTHNENVNRQQILKSELTQNSAPFQMQQSVAGTRKSLMKPCDPETKYPAFSSDQHESSTAESRFLRDQDLNKIAEQKVKYLREFQECIIQNIKNVYKNKVSTNFTERKKVIEFYKNEMKSELQQLKISEKELEEYYEYLKNFRDSLAKLDSKQKNSVKNLQSSISHVEETQEEFSSKLNNLSEFFEAADGENDFADNIVKEYIMKEFVETRSKLEQYLRQLCL